MKTLKKILIVLISTIMVCTLNINVFAEYYTNNVFSLSFHDCIYTPTKEKTDNEGYAIICCAAFDGNDTIKVTICDSNHRPVSNTVTISGASDVKKLTYTRLDYKGDYYCLRICSDNFASVAGYWTP